MSLSLSLRFSPVPSRPMGGFPAMLFLAGFGYDRVACFVAGLGLL